MKGWLLDTNVVSELARPRPVARVIEWLATLPPTRTHISVLTLAEVEQGIEALAAGDERRERYRRFADHLEAEFAGRILPLDDETVRLWGALSGRYRRDFGGKTPVVDSLLAATALRRKLYFATRNVADVQKLDCRCFDPWTDDPASYPLQF